MNQESLPETKERGKQRIIRDVLEIYKVEILFHFFFKATYSFFLSLHCSFVHICVLSLFPVLPFFRKKLHYPGGLIKLQQLDAAGRFTAWLGR